MHKRIAELADRVRRTDDVGRLKTLCAEINHLRSTPIITKHSKLISKKDAQRLKERILECLAEIDKDADDDADGPETGSDAAATDIADDMVRLRLHDLECENIKLRQDNARISDELKQLTYRLESAGATIQQLQSEAMTSSGHELASSYERKVMEMIDTMRHVSRETMDETQIRQEAETLLRAANDVIESMRIRKAPANPGGSDATLDAIWDGAMDCTAEEFGDKMVAWFLA